MVSPPFVLEPEVVAAIQAHAVTEYPKECVGIVTLSGAYLPMKNVSNEPETTAKWPRELGGLIAKGEVLAMVHSHPDGPNCPSALDMKSQHAYNLPWVIVSTNGEACLKPFVFGAEAAALYDRGFQHGVTDCYAFIRDWYFDEFGVRLPDFCRDWEWWKNEQNLYEEGFSKAGFIETTDLEVGDVFLYQIKSEFVNHGAIYLGDNLIAHHPSSASPFDTTKRPKREPLGRWERFRTHHLKYVGIVE